MTDVIKNVNTNQVSGSNVKSTSLPAKDSDKASSSNKAESATVASNDQVELTSTAQKLDEVVASLANEPVVDRQKVEAVKQALADGQYQIDSSNIAQKLIEIDELLK